MFDQSMGLIRPPSPGPFRMVRVCGSPRRAAGAPAYASAAGSSQDPARSASCGARMSDRKERRVSAEDVGERDHKLPPALATAARES